MPSPGPKCRKILENLQCSFLSVEMAHFAGGFSACPTVHNARTGRWWRRERNWDRTISPSANVADGISAYNREKGGGT